MAELTDDTRNVILRAAALLAMHKRRRFQAEMANAYCDGLSNAGEKCPGSMAERAYSRPRRRVFHSNTDAAKAPTRRGVDGHTRTQPPLPGGRDVRYTRSARPTSRPRGGDRPCRTDMPARPPSSHSFVPAGSHTRTIRLPTGTGSLAEIRTSSGAKRTSGSTRSSTKSPTNTLGTRRPRNKSGSRRTRPAGPRRPSSFTTSTRSRRPRCRPGSTPGCG